jgi:hypothetical protein
LDCGGFGTICGRFGAIIKKFDSNVHSVGVLNQRRGKKAPLSSIIFLWDIAILKILPSFKSFLIL